MHVKFGMILILLLQNINLFLILDKLILINKNMTEVSPRKGGKKQQKIGKMNKHDVNNNKKQKPSFVFGFMTQDRIEQATKLFTNSFVSMNPMWMKMGCTYEEIYGVLRGRMIQCMKGGWCSIMINAENNELAAVNMSLQLNDYLKYRSMPNNSPFFRHLMMYGQKVQDEYFQSLLPSKRGDYIYNYGGCINQKYANEGISKLFWAEGLVVHRLAGWKTFLGRSTNRITTRVLCSMGGKIVRTLIVKEPGLEGEVLEIIRIDLRDVTFDTLKPYIKEKQEDDEFE